MRKLIIGLIAVGFVASLFWGYALIMDPAPIEVQNVVGSDDLEMPESTSSVQQTGDTEVRNASEARYVILDPETKETSRVFGFDNLLNPGMDTSRREVEKPYLIFYESDYRCRIDADMGMFQVETSGSSSTPKDARLNGNVKIHITPKAGSRMSETIVEMDDLVFNSERSEFATDQKVHIKSDQVELKGTGLIVIFDPADGRISYLRIRLLDQIRMRGLSDPKSGTKIADAKTPHNTGLSNPTPTQPDTDSSDPPQKAKEAEAESPLRYYQCTLEDNVEIKYSDEIVVAGGEQVTIQHILFDRNAEGDETAEPTGDKSKDTPKSNKSSGQGTKTAQNVEPAPEVIVTCDGGIILRPMDDADAEQTPVAQSALSVSMGNTPLRIAKIAPDLRQTPAIGMANLAGEENVVADPTAAKVLPTTGDTALETASVPNSSPPTKFEARKIDYDLLTGSGLAHGPVRFTFYQPPDPNSAAPKLRIPIITTADENARFIADKSQRIKQVVFNGNVMTSRETQSPDFVRVDKIHSEKLTVDLDEVQTGSVDLSRLTVTEGRVYVESQRMREGRELSKTKLYCTEISYDKVADVILAKGPGKIEMVNNEDAQTAASDPNNPMNQPCVAVVDGFTAIRWDMGKQTIVADGQQDQLQLSYVPLVDGKPEKFIFIDAVRFDLSFVMDSTGKSAIKRVFTDEPIVYEEWNSDKTERLHYVTGQSLDYDPVGNNGWMKISGTPAVPCNVDGARMPEVLIHPITGQVDTSISTTPGILKGR